jgi:hypothetical protein
LVELVLLFGACERDIPAAGGEGEKVEILFSINTKSYDTEDQVVRGGADMSIGVVSATGSNAYMYVFDGNQNEAGIGGTLREIAGPVRCIRVN